MKDVYLVVHAYDVDGGFGDAIGCEDVIAAFSDEKDANDFVKVFQNAHIYDRPYADLICGTLLVRKVGIYDKFEEGEFDRGDFWWLKVGIS